MPDRVIPADTTTTTLWRPRAAALIAITTLVIAAAAASFAESYRALMLWALAHGLRSAWGLLFPVQVDSFIAVGELALFAALADSRTTRSRSGAWLVTGIGLAVSVAANVGHVGGHDIASRFSAAVPPLAASAALAVGLGVLKRVVGARTAAETVSEPTTVADTLPVSIEDMTAVIRPSLTLAWPHPDTEAEAQADTEADAESATLPVTSRPRNRTVTRTPNSGGNVRKASAIVKRQPGISGAELGRKLGVSERQGRRILTELAAA